MRRATDEASKSVRAGGRSRSLRALSAAVAMVSIMVSITLATTPTLQAAPGSPPSSADAPDWLPPAWVVGAKIDDQVIVAVDAHAEFVRIRFARGGFEIVACGAKPDQWCAQGLRIQPLPDMEASDAFFTARLAELRRHDDVDASALTQARRRNQPIRLPAEVARVAVAPEPIRVALALLLTLLLALRLTKGKATRRWIWLIAAIVVALPLLGRSMLGVTFAGPDGVAISSISLVHEGNEARVAELWTAPYSFADPAWLLTSAHKGFRGRVAANRLLHLLAVVLVLAWLRALAGIAAPRRWWMSLWVAGLFAFAAPMWVTASGETWAPALTVTILFGGIGVVAAGDDSLRKPWRWLGIMLIPLLATLTERRIEVWLVAAAAMAVSVARLRWTAAQRQAMAERIWARISVALRAEKDQGARLVGVCLAAFVVIGLVEALPVDGAGINTVAETVAAKLAIWADLETPSPLQVLGIRALSPANWAWLLMPIDLAIAFPMAWIALLLVAFVTVIRRDHSWLWLLVVVLSLFKVFRVAGHGHPYEMTRYLTGLAGPMAFLLGLGALRLEQWLDQPGRDIGTRRLALTAFAIATLIDGSYRSQMHVYGKWLRRAPLEFAEQIDARFVGRAVERWPACLLVTRLPFEVDKDQNVSREGFVLFGGLWHGPQRLTPQGAETVVPMSALAQAIETFEPKPACVLALAALDCNLVGSAGCDALADAGEPALTALSQPMKAYRHPHWGTLARNEVSLWLRPLAKRWRPEALAENMVIPAAAVHDAGGAPPRAR